MTTKLSAAQVADYLEQHPEFFAEQDELLSQMKVPHHTGGAVSLLERQLEIHRQRNVELRQRLSRLIDNARRNDLLFEKTKRMLLQLLAAQDLDEMLKVLQDHLRSEFEIEYASLQLFSVPDTKQGINLKLLSDSEIQTRIKRMFKGKQAICGEFTDEELVMLFPAQHNKIASGAAVFLRSHRPLGALAVGSRDGDKFRNSMDTLFLNFIGDVLSQVVPRHLPEVNSQGV